MSFQSRRLKVGGRLTPRGVAWATGAVLVMGLSVHSGAVRWHEHRVTDAFARIRSARGEEHAQVEATVAEANRELVWLARWGLVRPPDLDRGFASLALFSGRHGEAETYLRRYLAARPEDAASRRQLVHLLLAQGRRAEAERLVSGGEGR